MILLHLVLASTAAILGIIGGVLVDLVVSTSMSAFVVVHPDFENAPVDADLVAEVGDGGLVALLDFPADFPGELEHFLLLVVSEFGPEPLAGVGGWARGGSLVGHGLGSGAESEEHVGGGGGVVSGGDRRWRRWGVRAVGVWRRRRWRRGRWWWVVAVG